MVQMRARPDAAGLRHLGLLALFVLLLSAGCAAVSAERVDVIWEEVRSEYPGCGAGKPRVVWVSGPIYVRMDGGKRWCYGAYIKASHTVLLSRDWAGERTVRHEFRHACGDRLGHGTGRLEGEDRSEEALAAGGR